MSRARELSKLGNLNVLSADDVSNEVGIASTVPRSTLDVRGELQVGTGIQVGPAGVITATSFSGGTSGNVTGAACTFTTGTFNGNVTIGGTLTYEDVTNIDSLGIVTARAGVNVSGGQLAVGVAYSVGAAGVATAAGFVGPLTGAVTGNADTATTATTATNVTVTANNSTDETVYPIFVDGATGSQGAESDTGLTYNPSDGNLTSTTFTGNVVGNQSGGSITATTGTFSQKTTVNATLEATEGINVTAGVGTFAGDVSIADKIVHTGDTNTAIRFPAADTVSVETSGSERLRVDSSGRLLVGLTTARTAVGAVGDPFNQQEGLGADTGAMSIIRNTDSAAGPYLIFGKTRGTSDGSNTIVQASDTIGSILFAPADGNDINQVCASITAMINGTPGSNDVPGALTFRTTADGGTSPTERVRIMPDGSFGLGTSDPKALLEVNSATGGDVVLVRLRSNPTIGEAQYLAFDGSSNSTRARIGSEIQNGGHGELVFETRDTSTTNLTERLRITDQGRIGIGRTDPQSLFEVAGATPIIRSTDTDSANDYSVFQNSSGSSVYNAVDGGDVGAHIFQANGAEKVRIDSNGRLGIGTANPASQIAIYGADASIRLFDTSGGTSSAYRIMAYNGINYIQSGTEFSSDSSADFVFSTMFGSTEHLRIKANGGLDLVGNAQLLERVKITAGKLSDNTNIDLDNGMVHYFTTQESTTCTPNIRIDGSNTLQNAMATGQVCTVTLITTAAAGGYSANVTIDGNAVTEEWVGGEAPSEGGSDGLDIYVYTIICIGTGTGNSGFKVIANNVNASN